MKSSRWHRRALAKLSRRPDAQIDLAEAALLIACEEYPGLDVEGYLRWLDNIACECRSWVRPGAGIYQVIGAINRGLFHELGFQGDRRNYYDPANCYLNQVLERRLGIPVTLSILYLEVAWRLGFPMQGVGLPGHFIVKYVDSDEEIYIDPFYDGMILSPEDCQERVYQATGDPDLFQSHHLGAVTKRQILLRLLHNLKSIYVGREEYARSLAVIELILLIAPWDLDEVRDRGLVHYHLGHYRLARRDLETYLAYRGDAEDASRIAKVLEMARERVPRPGGEEAFEG